MSPCLVYYSRAYSAVSPFYHDSAFGLGHSRHLFGARVRCSAAHRVEDCIHSITLTTGPGIHALQESALLSHPLTDPPDFVGSSGARDKRHSSPNASGMPPPEPL
jgi:hypothetical protein